jgi:hypothetical protein
MADQPRYKAFLLHTGANPERVQNWEYIVWNSQKWAEWRKMNGLGRWDCISPKEHERFTAWLFDTLPEDQLTLF